MSHSPEFSSPQPQSAPEDGFEQPQPDPRPARPRPPATPVTWAILLLTIGAWLVANVVPRVAWELALFPELAHSQPWRLLTSALVHFDILHLGLNMLALWMMGRALETLFGPWRFLALYLGSILGGSALALIWSASSPGAVVYGGASGGLFGMFGALAVLQAFRLVRSGSLLPVLGLNLAISFLIPGIAWQAHLGGLVIGAGIGWAIARHLRRETTARTQWLEVGLIILTAAVGCYLPVILG